MRVIIETPRGKGQKYDFDPQSGYFILKKIMPAGMVFPFDFGFFPGTIGEDGDPIDVIVISEIETFPGCMMECRVIGAITAEQRERDGQSMRNDRYIAIPEVSQLYANINDLENLPQEMITQLEHFFISYNQQAEKEFKPLGRLKAQEAQELLSSTKDQSMQTSCMIQVYLPLYDPAGTAFPQSHFDKIKKELTDKFGGLTMYTRSPAEGLWKENEQKVVKDDILIYEVIAKELEQDFWLEYKNSLKKTFKQEELLIRSTLITTV
jgi:inorganic pyrophosphatase